MPKPTLDASGVAEYIHFECCPKYFKLRFEGEEEKKDRAWAEAFKPISPLLYGSGERLEERKWNELRERVDKYYDLGEIKPDELGWDESWKRSTLTIQEAVREASKQGTSGLANPVLLYQVPVFGSIGDWNVRGLADLVAVWPCSENSVKIRVFEIKASWKERTYHRIQVAIYALLFSEAVRHLGIPYEIEGGIIHKKSELEKLSPDGLPKFELEPIIEDVKRILGKNGELIRIDATPIHLVEHQLSWKCETCIYNECCFTRAIEGEDISLLNLTRGEQRALRRHGIEKLEDLARLKQPLDPREQFPNNFKEIPAVDMEKVQELNSNPVIGRKLNHIIQRAQFMLGPIRPTSKFIIDRKTPPWITATGYGYLPEDSPPVEFNINIGYPRGGLIRVYLHAQWDYMLDMLVMISARISCTNYRGDSISTSKIVESLPDQPQECVDSERRMLEGFFRELTSGIQQIAREIGSPDAAPIHLYFYTNMERDRLMDAVRRHHSLLSARAVQDLLGLRQAIDQPMVSIVQNEIVERKALKYPNPGLIPVVEQCFNENEGWWKTLQWIVFLPGGGSIDLRRVFYHGLFNYASPYERGDNGSIRLMLERGAFKSSEKEGWYPVRARFGSQIPLEYIWAAKGRLDPGEEASHYAKMTIEKRMFRDYPLNRERITDNDLTVLGAKLCHALEHVERSFSRGRNLRLTKRPIAIPRIEEFTLGETSLQRGCNEYLALEYFFKRQELFAYHALAPIQRVSTGRSLVLSCTSAVDQGRDVVLEGRLIYREMGFPDVQQIVNACRIKGSDGLSSGDWMLSTEVHWNENGQIEEVEERSPSRIELSPRAIVEDLDLANLTIRAKVLGYPPRRTLSTWHDLPTTDPDEANTPCKQFFEAGRMYILDEMADDLVSERSMESLENVDSNPLYHLLSEYLTGEITPIQQLSLAENAAEFLHWLIHRRVISPKDAQLKFIQKSLEQNRLTLLQGPPGTGKTETLQCAVLAHVAAHRQRARCRVLMVGPTHKAIHEFLTKLAECWRNYNIDGGSDLGDLRIMRVISNENAVANEIEGVTYVNYHEDRDLVDQVRNLLTGQAVLDQPDEVRRPIIVCATPPGMYGLMKKIGGNALPWGQPYFDLLVVDEASMMRLPELILSGAFIREDAQVLIAGDHRQLPPIQAHDWEKEDRRTIEEIAPFLSAQDFVRLLRNEKVDLKHVRRSPPADIPVVRLDETLRCHQVVADYLKKWVYSSDGIDFWSNQTQTISPVAAHTEGLRTVLEPENVLVLLVHDERESYQSNVVEANIVRAMVQNVKNDDVGIITPHNAQRGLLKSVLRGCGSNVRVDTVERFQGGEGDFIIISATVSDPDYVRAESDFLLNVNRLNVAMSRMKKKLVVIASRSIFEYMPQDAQDYDKAKLWRGLLHMVGFTEGKEPAWEGSLAAFLGEPAPDVGLQVYAVSQVAKD